MRISQTLALVGAFVSFVLSLRFSTSITNEVNETSGTNYERLWSFDGNTIWNNHAEAYPSSRKRLFLALTISLWFGLLLLAACLTQ